MFPNVLPISFFTVRLKTWFDLLLTLSTLKVPFPSSFHAVGSELDQVYLEGGLEVAIHDTEKAGLFNTTNISFDAWTAYVLL